MGRYTSFIIASLLLASSAWAQGSTTIRDGNGDGVADVINTTPSGTEYGMVVRPIGGGAGGGDGALLDGVSAAIKATVFDFPNSNPLGVVLRDTNGDYVSVGGGTQYSQGDAATSTDVMTMAGCVRADSAAVATGVADGDRARCIVDSIGRLWSHIGTIDGGTITTITNPVAVSNSFLLDATYTGRMPAGASPTDNESNTNTALSRIGTFNYVFDGAAWDRWTGAVSQSGTWNITNISGTVSLPTGAATLAEQQTQTTALQLIDNIVSGNGVNITQFGGTNVSTGTGASGAGIPRVTVANDSNILATQSGTWNIGTVTTLTGITNALPTGANTLGAVTGTAADNSANSSLKLPVLATRANAVAPSWTEGNQAPLSVDLAGNLRVNSTGGGVVDNSTFTLGTTTESPAGGVFSDAAPYLVDGKTAAIRATQARALHENLRDNTGQEVGTRTNPLIVDVNRATFGQPQAMNKLNKVFAQPSFLTGTLGNRVGTVGDRLKVDQTPSDDLCSSRKKTDVAISQTATTRLITAPPGGQSIYVCMIRVVAGVAEIVSEWEGTGTNCGTGTVAHSGSATVANGESFAANGGYASGDGTASVITVPPGKDFCLAQNGANRVSGKLAYVIGP